MAFIELKIENLVLDHDNPRITHAEGQQQALQKVVKNQKAKLLRLAQSIVDRGLSPIERLMVLEVNSKPKRYIALEGNRRTAVLRLLTNPNSMTGLDMPAGMQKAMEKLAAVFDKGKVEPLQCFEVSSREEGKYWIELRHNGENQGRGVVGWEPIVAARFRKRGPDIEAFDLVMEHGGFSEDEVEELREGFPLSTLGRFMESPEVRKMLGLNLKSGHLFTDLPAAEVIKPLKKIVLDLANKKGESRRFNKTAQMVDYVSQFKKGDKPDLTKKVAERPIEGLEKSEFGKTSRKSRKRRASNPDERKFVVPKNCELNVKDNRISEIYEELRKIKMVDARNAIAVLLRVFLELSVDHFLEKQNKVSLTIPNPNGKPYNKRLDQKLQEAVNIMVAAGAPHKDFASVIRSLSVSSSPMNIDLLHSYMHNRFATPSPQELTSAWNNAQGLFEKIWP